MIALKTFLKQVNTKHNKTSVRNIFEKKIHSLDNGQKSPKTLNTEQPILDFKGKLTFIF